MHRGAQRQLRVHLPDMRSRHSLTAAAAYLALTLAWSWPLPLHLSNRFTHDPGDPLLLTYLLWWNAHAVPLTRAWWNAPFFWPLPDALALTEHVAGLSPVSTPIQLAGGSPLLAYNLIVILSTWWAGLATYALVCRLTGNRMAAWLAGVAFAFAPYRTSQLGHLQLYACWWLPVMLLALHAYMDAGRGRWLLLFGIAWLLQALTNGYYLLFFPVLLLAWVLWFTPWKSHPSRSAAVAFTWIIFSIPLIPMLLEYWHIQTRLGLSRGRMEMIMYSARWRSFLATTPLMRFWHTPPPQTTEQYLFPGLTVCVLVAAAAVSGLRSRTFVFYVGFAVLAAWLCAGPTPEPFSIASFWRPYNAVAWLPGFTGLRVPSRFFMLVSLCLAVAAGVACAHLAARIRWPRLLSMVVFAGLVIDGAITSMPLGVPPGNLAFRERDARILELPLEDAQVDVVAMYRSMSHRMLLVNGYAGYIPPHVDVIQWALRRRDPSILAELRRGHPLYVVVRTVEEGIASSRFVEAQPGAEMLGVSGGGRVFRLPPAPQAREIPVGAPLPVGTVVRSGDALAIDLGTEQTVRAVELRTFGYLTRLPGTVRIETSIDGTSWALACDELPGGPALVGALEQPLVIPLRLFLPDVRARYLRINAPLLGTRAVTVYGPS